MAGTAPSERTADAQVQLLAGIHRECLIVVRLTQAGHGIADVRVSDGTEPGPEHCLLTTVGIIHDRKNGIKDLGGRILAVVSSLSLPFPLHPTLGGPSRANLFPPLLGSPISPVPSRHLRRKKSLATWLPCWLHLLPDMHPLLSPLPLSVASRFSTLSLLVRVHLH